VASLEREVMPVPQESQVQKDHLVLPDPTDLEAFPERLVAKEKLDPQVDWEHQEREDLPESQAIEAMSAR